MFYVLLLLCFQTCFLFSMENSFTELTVDYVLAAKKIETPQFNPPAMILFFNSPSLKQFCDKVKDDTDNFIKTLSHPEAFENTIRKTHAIQYCCLVTMLYGNKLIISSLNKCLLPIPIEYQETEKDFKKFWYDLWQLIIQQGITPEETLKKINNPYFLSNYLYKLREKREQFINFFKYTDTPDYFHKELVSMETYMTKDVEQDSSKLFFQYILPTLQKKTQKFATISDRISTLKKKHTLFQYTGPRPLTKTEEYPSFTKINTYWKNAWESLDPQEKAKACEQFCLELDNYIAYLDEHLTKAEETNNSKK